MKPKLFLKTTLLFLCFSFSCDKEENLSPEEQLPPVTETGEGTFACLIDGELFNDTGGGYFNSFYQYVNGGYYFGLGADDDNSLPQHIYLKLDNIEIEEGSSYNLIEDNGNSAYAGAGFRFTNQSFGVYTNSQFSGELIITKFDREERIVSGTFWFDLKHPLTGDTVKFRKGRFDTLFTQ